LLAKLGWKEDGWRKQAAGVSLVRPKKRPRTKDDDEEEDWDMTLKHIQASRLTLFRNPSIPPYLPGICDRCRLA
jgi:hypothetical protein